MENLTLELVEAFVSMCTKNIVLCQKQVCRGAFRPIAIEEREGDHEGGDGNPMFDGKTNDVAPFLLHLADFFVEEIVLEQVGKLLIF